MTSEEREPAKTRVVLANMPRILATIVRDLVDRQPDMGVVATVRLADVVSAARSLHPEAVILTPSRADPAHATREALRRERPDLAILELRFRDGRAVLWAPPREPVAVELSAAGVVAALRHHVVSAKGGMP